MKYDFFKDVKTREFPYIIAEIGANHNGDMELAKTMIRAAKECGCDAAKFQSWTPDSLIAKEEYDRNQTYNDSPKKHFGSLEAMVEKYYLRDSQHFELKTFCDEIGIHFCSSPFSPKEADLLKKLDVPFIKIASMDVNNPEFLKHVARLQKPVVLSTGMATLHEIEAAVKTIEGEGNREIILLHCISVYPPDHKDINLRNILMLKEVFGYPVGFSDHSFGTSIPLASVALGAKIIEKHFTIDKNMEGWDHDISADIPEMKVIVSDSAKIVASLGSYQRIVSEAEEKKKLKFRRSIVTNRDLSGGHLIKMEDLTFKRPGTGIRPDEAKYVIGRKINRNIKADELLKWDDLL
jgi:sialic acid synthase SpsE